MGKMDESAAELVKRLPIIRRMQQEEEIIWINPDKAGYEKSMENSELTMADVEDAESRLQRFAPVIMWCFPETKERNGAGSGPRDAGASEPEVWKRPERETSAQTGQSSGDRRLGKGKRRYL